MHSINRICCAKKIDTLRKCGLGDPNDMIFLISKIKFGLGMETSPQTNDLFHIYETAKDIEKEFGTRFYGSEYPTTWR